MKPSFEILNELKSINSYLSEVDRVNPLKVPGNYFFKLKEKLFIKISSLNKTLNEPQGYFNSLPGIILKRIRENEIFNGNINDNLDESFTLLNELKHKNIFTIPDGYFDNVSIDINKYQKHKAPIRTLIPKRYVWKQAVAAIIVGVIALNAFLFFNHSKDRNSKSVSVNSLAFSYIQAAKQYNSEDQINKGISKLSNEEIINYLTSNGSEVDNEQLISNIREVDLPAQGLNLNEKEVNSYLNN